MGSGWGVVEAVSLAAFTATLAVLVAYTVIGVRARLREGAKAVENRARLKPLRLAATALFAIALAVLIMRILVAFIEAVLG